MSDINSTNESTLSPQDSSAKTNALIAYGLMIVGLFTFLPWIAGAIWAMVKKSDANGSQFSDHYNNLIKVFWVGLGIGILCFILAATFIGGVIAIPLALFLLVWTLYKLIKGVANLTSNKPYSPVAA